MKKVISEITVDVAFDFGVAEGKKQILKELLVFGTKGTFMHKLMEAKLKELETKVTLERTLRSEETETTSET